MGQLFSQRCDLCQHVQTEDEPAKIQGTSFSMNGATKFACGECKKMLDAAFSVGAEGLRDPLKALAAMTAERDELKRLLTQATVRRDDGDLGLIGVEFDHKQAQRFNAMSPSERFRALGQSAPPPAQKKIGYTDDKKKPKKK